MSSGNDRRDLDFLRHFWRERRERFLQALGAVTLDCKIERKDLTPEQQMEILDFHPPDPQKCITQAIITITIWPSYGKLLDKNSKLVKDLRTACRILQPYFQYFRVDVRHPHTNSFIYATSPGMILLKVPGLENCYVHWKRRDLRQLEKFLRNPIEYWQANARLEPVADYLDLHFHTPGA
ncbi:hypothetical protein F5Y04DRAFT_278933 [Hypomontagnella monticulosa]|nr:hypothetical protein F5Y04DRAFT_278933 [Hypomontagnella monticulosa]